MGHLLIHFTILEVSKEEYEQGLFFPCPIFASLWCVWLEVTAIIFKEECVFSEYWLGLCILLPYDGGYTYFLFMECVANGCLVENYSTILFFCRISFSYVLCFRSFWHPFYYIIFLNSLISMRSSYMLQSCKIWGL